MNKFELTSAYQPTGDQPEAIKQLTEGVCHRQRQQTHTCAQPQQDTGSPAL